MSEYPIILASLCVGCGACCMTINSPPFDVIVDEGVCELDDLPDSVRAEYEAGMHIRKERGYPDGVPCFWLTPDKRCLHYDHRPAICHEFSVGGEACQGYRNCVTEPEVR